ncbi:MAG TPA: Trp biosynthesis-associated membrane protein, partial [Pilimelia sp.]|nr:Trp biosynthesis-associated membrane protein [Pilimelia sp.]
AYAVLLCGVGAGVALLAARMPWHVEVTAQPAPLPEVRDVRTGAELRPWLPALMLVGLAAAGALLAVRGAARAAVGAVAVCCGLAGASGALAVLAADGAVRQRAGWPVLTALGALALAAGGALAAARGRRWPALGARYDRRPPAGAGSGGAGPGRDGAAGPAAAGPGGADHGPAGGRRGRGAPSTVEAWDALDRGEDPTDR